MRKRRIVAFDRDDFSTVAVDMDEIDTYSPQDDGCFLHMRDGEVIFVFNRYDKEVTEEYDGKTLVLPSVQQLCERVSH